MGPGRREIGTAATGRERGSASVWVVAFAGLIVSVAAFGVARNAAVAARHRIERSADLTALAGAEQIGRGRDPCAVAAQVASANGARITYCRASLDPSRRSGTVSVVVSAWVALPIVGPRTAVASARAVREPPGT